MIFNTKLKAVLQEIGSDVKSILNRIDKLENKPTNDVAPVAQDRILVYRRTQHFDFIDKESGSYAWSGNQIQYSFPVPKEFVGKFCEVFINGNVDARVPSMPDTLTLYSQNPTDKDEILIVGYEDSEHVEDTLNAHGL